jgi:hypothetical protein
MNTDAGGLVFEGWMYRDPSQGFAGLVSTKELRQLIAIGRISRTDRVWKCTYRGGQHYLSTVLAKCVEDPALCANSPNVPDQGNGSGAGTESLLSL